MSQPVTAKLRIAGIAVPLSLAMALLAAPAAFAEERGDRWERDGNGRADRTYERNGKDRGRPAARPAQGREDRRGRPHDAGPDRERPRGAERGERRRETRPGGDRRRRAERPGRRPEARPERESTRRSEPPDRHRADSERDGRRRVEDRGRHREADAVRERRREADGDRERHRQAQRWDRDRDGGRHDARPDRDRRRTYERRGERRWHRGGSHRARSFHIPHRWHYRHRPHHRHLRHRHYGRVWWCGVGCRVPVVFGFTVWTRETLVSHESEYWFPIWEALEYNRTGETSLWESDWGYVEFTPTRTFRSGYGPHGRDCRDFHRVVVRHHDGLERHYRGTACRTPYGEWWIVS